MSKNNENLQITWVPGQCRLEGAASNLSFTEIKNAIKQVAEERSEELEKVIPNIKKEMDLLDLFRADLHMAKLGIIQFPRENYPNANQEFLDDVEKHLAGQENVDFSKYV